MPNIYWLQKQVSYENEPQLWPLEFSASQKLTELRTRWYPYGTYLQMLTQNLTEKSHNSLFLRDQTQTTRNISKTLHVYISGGFKLLLILSFIIASNLKGELLL